ncbi:MAG: FAD-binding oxidoreductase [Patescibacteria group bacterium]|nr:FAD-binding oxidoreductase [Patescibacteria group bacterium]MDE2015702.1 FAD-binding oxidoreductase [Patescibacteria group bacterium]MDE2226760.1 FAD-binding oxidoreductase [Patescibacteria group bacterium]
MLADELKQFFHGDVLDDGKTLATYSRDYSIFKVKPQAVVFPKNAEDVKNLVKFSVKAKGSGTDISLTARSAGTDMSGGPLNNSVIVEFAKYFNQVKEIKQSAEGGSAVVQPGVYFRDFEKELKKIGLLYPPYPASKDLCALGGMISNNSGGEKTLAYGKTEDYVEELKVVLSDGEEHTIKPLSKEDLKTKIQEDGFEGRLYKRIYELIENNYDAIRAAKPDVSKNSAGYYLWNVWDGQTFDLNRLFVGSQGTLGLVTEAKLRLVREKKYSRLAVVFLKDLAPLADLVVEILKFKPESLESYDDKTLNVALKYLPEIVKSMGGHFFKLIWQFLPEAMMVLRGGLPKMVLIIELNDDDSNELEKRLFALRAAVKTFSAKSGGVQARILKSEEEAEKYWTIRRQSFALLHNHSINKDTAPFIDDLIVKPEYLPKFLPELNVILDKYKKDLVYTIAGHPGNGNFHIIPLMDLKRERIRALIPKISEEVYSLVFKYKGSITAEHNDGLIRTPYLEKMYGKKIVELFAEVKKIFDPLDIFNPGKKVGGNLDYMISKIESSR